jgi:hypothetical protein
VETAAAHLNPTITIPLSALSTLNGKKWGLFGCKTCTLRKPKALYCGPSLQLRKF